MAYILFALINEHYKYIFCLNISENIAQLKSASQYGTIGQSEAGLAIDGYKDGNATRCAMTDSYHPAIYVTEYFYIQTVTIYRGINPGTFNIDQYTAGY